MNIWMGRTGVGMAMFFLMTAQAQAERVSRAAPGTAPCGDDRAVRVLVIGGELQANSWCTKEAKAARRTAHEDKKRQEREEYKRKQEEERAKRKAEDEARREADKRRREEEKRKRDEAKKKHDCRGVGTPAGCTEANPGNGRAMGNKNK